MPGRSFSSPNYRFGFNGKENDNEVKGITGSQQDYGMRIYDPRLGKFLSGDPLTSKYAMLSPYQFASNRPIDGIDLDGLEFCGYGYLADANAEAFAKLNCPTATGIFSTYTHALFFDPVYMAHGLMKDIQSGDNYRIAKHLDLFGVSSLFEIYDNAYGKKADPRNPAVQEARGSFWTSVAIFVINMKIAGSFEKSNAPEATNVCTPLTIPERLNIFIEKLRNADPVSSADDALNQINKTLVEVEDAYSGIEANPKPSLKSDGRMYPIQEDYVTRHSNGNITALSKGHRVEINKNGSYTIYERKTGNIVLDKKGN